MFSSAINGCGKLPAHPAKPGDTISVLRTALLSSHTTPITKGFRSLIIPIVTIVPARSVRQRLTIPASGGILIVGSTIRHA